MPYKFNPFTGNLDEVLDLSGLVGALIFKGDITVAGDFPTSAEVENGWTYFVKADVTDNDATKTNTGQSFEAGDEIAWNGTNWTELGSTELWSRSGTILSPKTAGDDISTSGDITGGNLSGTNTGDQDLSAYELLANKSTNVNLGTSDTLYVSQKAIKAYVDAAVLGEDFWDRSGTVLSPKNSGDDVDLENANLLNTGYIDFDLSSSYVSEEGRLGWDTDCGTLQVGMAGGNVTQQIGQEVFLPRGKAIGSNISNGQIVYISGASGSKPELTLAKADSSSTSKSTIAMATEDISENQNGYYTAFGVVRDIAVPTATYLDGDTLYLSATTAGGFTNVKPVQPGFLIKIGYVMRAHDTEGSIFININQRTNNFEHILGMTPTYIPFANTHGFLDESTNFTFDGNNVSIIAPSSDLHAATKKYVDDSVSAEDFWDRTGTTLSPNTTNDSINIGSGNFTTTGLGAFGELDVDTLNLNGNVISDITGTISFSNDNLTTTGSITTYGNIFKGGTNTTALNSGYGCSLNLVHPDTNRDAAFFSFNKLGDASYFGFQRASVYGTNDLFMQSGLNSNAAYFVLEAWQTKGLMLMTGGSGGIGQYKPIIFKPNRVTRWTMNGTSGDFEAASDNIKTTWGTSKDCYINYDGTDMIIDSGAVSPSDMKIDCGTNKTIALQDEVWDDQQINLSSVKLPTSQAPAWVDFKGSQVLEFAAGSTNKIYFTAQLSHKYKIGEDIEFHLHTSYPDSNAGNVRWKFTHSWSSIGAATPAETTVNTTIAAPARTDYHELDEIADTITGTSKGISSMILCCLEREGADDLDTYAGDVKLLAADFHIPIDTIGSRQESSK